MQEIWKDIKGYEGLYQVSNFGNVKSLERRVNSYSGGRNKKEKYIIDILCNNCYNDLVTNCNTFVTEWS